MNWQMIQCMSDSSGDEKQFNNSLHCIQQPSFDLKLICPDPIAQSLEAWLSSLFLLWVSSAQKCGGGGGGGGGGCVLQGFGQGEALKEQFHL